MAWPVYCRLGLFDLAGEISNQLHEFGIGALPALGHQLLSGCFRLWLQPVDATHWLIRSAGVSKFNVSLGLSLSLLATAFSLF